MFRTTPKVLWAVIEACEPDSLYYTQPRGVLLLEEGDNRLDAYRDSKDYILKRVVTDKLESIAYLESKNCWRTPGLPRGCYEEENVPEEL